MKSFLLLFAFLLSGIVFAQNAEQKQILEDTRSFMKYLEQKNYDKILEMSHPALTEKFERKMLIDAFKMVFEGNDELSIKIDPIDDSKYIASDVFTEGESRYAFVSFPLNMEMVFKKQKLDEAAKKMLINAMEVQGMKARFVNDSTFQVSKLSLTLALKDKSTNNLWKYINHDDNNALYTSLVPVEIIKKARSYYSDLLIKQKENAN